MKETAHKHYHIGETKMTMATAAILSKISKTPRLYNLQIHRQLSSVVQESFQVNDDCTARVENGVPFLFLPHSVRKAYNIKSGVSTSLPKVFDKYKWLTKTLSTPTIPDEYLKVEATDDFDKLNQLFHDTIAQTVAYQKAPRNRNARRLRQERIKHSLISNLLRLTMSYHANEEHLQQENSLLMNEAILETHWVRNYKFYTTELRPTFTLKTREGFPVIEDTSEILPDDIDKIPGPYGPYAMNLYRHPVVHLNSRPCMDNSRFSSFQHCHTTININNRLRTDEQLYTFGMFTMFAQLAAQAQSTGELQGTELKTPLVTQCIVTNGHAITFMIYQLNTLNMLTDKGVWNRCWYLPMTEIYERNNERGHNNIYEEALCQPRLNGYHENLAEYFSAFIARKTCK